MCRLHFGSLLCCAILVGTMLIGCHRNPEEAKTTVGLFATQANEEEFRSLFAIEPTCHGLSLSETAPIRLHYYGAVDAGRTQFGGYVVYPKGNTDLDFSESTAKEAIGHACAILKGQGGKVE